MNENELRTDWRAIGAANVIDGRSELGKALDKIPELEARIVELEEMVRELTSRMEYLWSRSP